MSRTEFIKTFGTPNIDKNNRGLTYKVGDPVVFYGGLSSNTGYGASAVVGSTTTGSVQRITVDNGGFGYTSFPNTIISFSNLNTGAATPIAQVGTLNPTGIANVAFIPSDIIGVKSHITIGNTQYNFANNIHANANTSLTLFYKDNVCLIGLIVTIMRLC